MDQELARINDYVEQIRILVDTIKGALLGDRPPNLQRFDVAHDDYIRATKETNNLLLILTSARHYAQVAKSLFRMSEKSTVTQEHVDNALKLAQKSNELIDITESIISKMSGVLNLKLPVENATAPTAKEIQEFHERLLGSLQDYERRLINRIEKADGRLGKQESAIDKLEATYSEKFETFDTIFANVLAEIKAKNDQLDKILGHAAGRVIAGDYESSARSEKSAADWLRNGSLVCMALIVCILGYSFYETTKLNFDAEKSIFRVILAFLLSAPTAYLARESSKHRAQQYLHLQTSLDLKAISPYIASLPEETQHKIKTDIATKLFGNRELPPTPNDSFPINVQELLMEAIKRPWLGDNAPKAPERDKP
ncbi:hypothetical protein [Pseudacidovorax sp. NFM-22]|uniref:hypothetical protein n=1 Tax=Pseudacidovorax sp. NFM-22 TaxID=2744469 RepID=UPI001F18E01B|nr:hypothetical protein [Pseudacidovorax sp. NFM-22]